MLPHGGYTDMIATTTLLNRVGAKLAQGSCGPRHDRRHRLRPARPRPGNGARLECDAGARHAGAADPLPRRRRWRRQGCVTGASHRNWASYGNDVTLPADCPDWQRHLLTDPQTSGGLLVACVARARRRVAAQHRRRRLSFGAYHRPHGSRSPGDPRLGVRHGAQAYVEPFVAPVIVVPAFAWRTP